MPFDDATVLADFRPELRNYTLGANKWKLNTARNIPMACIAATWHKWHFHEARKALRQMCHNHRLSMLAWSNIWSINNQMLSISYAEMYDVFQCLWHALYWPSKASSIKHAYIDQSLTVSLIFGWLALIFRPIYRRPFYRKYHRLSFMICIIWKWPRLSWLICDNTPSYYGRI